MLCSRIKLFLSLIGKKNRKINQNSRIYHLQLFSCIEKLYSTLPRIAKQKMESILKVKETKEIEQLPQILIFESKWCVVVVRLFLNQNKIHIEDRGIEKLIF